MTANSNPIAWTPIDLSQPLNEQINNRVEEVKEVVGYNDPYDSSRGWPAQDIWAMFGYIIFSLNEEFEEEGTGLGPDEIKHIYRIVHKNLINSISGPSQHVR